ncbi:MAG: M12 family metallo-peptidase [Saprospiraceae bacterium]
MRQNLILSAFFVLCCITSYSQAIWQINDSNISSEVEHENVSTETVYNLNTQMFQQALNQCPTEDTYIKNGKSVIIPIPYKDGTQYDFVMWQSDIAEEELLNKYPQFKSYKGFNIVNPEQVIRLTSTPNGFYGTILLNGHTTIIEPLKEKSQEYRVFNESLGEELSNFVCGTEEKLVSPTREIVSSKRVPDGFIQMRKYRMALACTGVWGDKRGTKEKVLEEMMIFLDRANLIFESELAVRMVLTAKNDAIIFLDPNNDPYNEQNIGGSLVGQNTNILNNIIGRGNYDIGHIFSVCFDVGGIAGGTVCSDNKGAGVTCFNGSSISTYIVLVFCHEVGHQMAASHTFNRCGDSSQLALGTGFEPGSGNTIMSYSGLCGSDNVGTASESYYHVASLDQIYSYTNQDGAIGYSCAEKIETGNHLPVITSMPRSGLTIPPSTPFVLNASATDADGDAMTYSWEQFDAQISIPLGDTTQQGNSPLFKSGKPNKATYRLFPTNTNILNANHFTSGDMLPFNSRKMTFRFIVRDNNPTGNGAAWEEMDFNVDGSSKPFRFLAPTGQKTYTVGENITIEWEVGNTNKAPINVEYVDIYVSSSTQLVFDSETMIPVALQIPNTGTANITIPNVISNNARIIIKARDNIFFTVSRFNAKIIAPTNPTFYSNIPNPIQTSCLPDPIIYDIESEGFNDFDLPIHCEVIGSIPSGATYHFEKPQFLPGEANSLIFDLSDVEKDSMYFLTVRTYVIDGDTIDRQIVLITKGTDIDNLAQFAPLNGLSGLATIQNYYWEKRQEANYYVLEVSKNADFTNPIIQYETQDTFYKSNVYLEKATIYFWRVKASNPCRSGEWSQVFAFQTESVKCLNFSSGDLSLVITHSGKPTVTLPLAVNVTGVIEDLNVAKIRGQHQNIKDLTVKLIAPSGKSGVLWSNMCPSNAAINVGFDDESSFFLGCPLSTGRLMKPQSPLNEFKGENILGQWLLEITDNKVGDGGTINEINLEFCSKISLSPPVINQLDTAKVLKKESIILTPSYISVTDPNNSDDEIIFTLTDIPTQGYLKIKNKEAQVGDTFSQKDITTGQILYQHTADNLQPDKFNFITTDNEGGWTGGVHTLPILVQEIVSTNDPHFENVTIYPNPFHDIIYISSSITSLRGVKYILYDNLGTKCSEGTIDNNQIQIGEQPSGVYIIHIILDKNTISKKIVKT